MRSAWLPLAACLVLATGCGAATSVGAVGSLPIVVSSTASNNAEACDDGDLRACTWLGVWFTLGGAGASRKQSGRRFIRHACKGGYSPACKLTDAVIGAKQPAVEVAP